MPDAETAPAKPQTRRSRKRKYTEPPDFNGLIGGTGEIPDVEDSSPLVEELRELNQQADEGMSPYEVTLRQMLLTGAAILTESGGCASCVAILRSAALAGVAGEDEESGEETEGEPTCGMTRGRYVCSRPPFHIPSDLHATTDGKFTCYWRDHEHRVTLKLSPSEEVLRILRGVKADSEEAETLG